MRTTIIADDHLLLELRGLAKRTGKSLTEIIQEALRNYLSRFKKRNTLSFAGIGAHKGSGPSIGRKTDEVIAQALKKRGEL